MGKIVIVFIVSLLVLINLNSSAIAPTASRADEGTDFHDTLYTNIDEVTAIAVDNTSIWYGTNGGGVVRYYPELDIRLVFTIVDGLPSNKINDIVIDEFRSYVWAVTDNGIGVYDKRSTAWSSLTAIFESHELGTFPELKAEFTCITVTQNDIWVGNSNNEIIKLEYQNYSVPLSFAQYTLSNNPVPNRVNDLKYKPDNEVLWVAARDGVYTYEYQTSIINNFGVEEGYDLKNVNTLAIRGSMVWFGTDHGAMSYNQQTEIFETYSMEYGLISNQVLGLDIQPSGQYGNVVWFCTPSGVTKHYALGNSWYSYTVQDGLGANYVNCAAYDEKNNCIWFGTCKGLTELYFKQDSWRTIMTMNGISSNNIKNIQFDHSGRPWIIMDNGLGFYENQAWIKFKMAQEKAEITSIGFTKDEVWIGSDIGIEVHAQPQAPDYYTTHLETYLKTNGLPSETINELEIGPDGTVWIGTDNGAACYQNEQWITLNLSGLNGNKVTSIAIDDDFIWIGTYDNGIMVYNTIEQTNQVINLKNGLISNGVNTIVIDQIEEIVWVGTDKGVSRLYQPYGLWYNFTESMGLINNNVTSIATPPEEDMVFFGTPEGLSVYRGYYGFSTISINEGLASNNVSCLAVNNAEPGIIWIGTDSGISRYNLEAKQWRTHSTATGLSANDVRIVALDDNRIWVGAYGGVDLYDKTEARWRTYTTDDGLSNNFVYDIVPDDELVWFGTDGGGVAVYNKNTDSWSQYMMDDGLVADDVISIELDTVSGEIWFGTDNGASLFNRSSNRWTTYSPSDDGLADDWVADIKVDDNNVWFATNKGVSRFDRVNNKWATYTYNDGLGHDVAKSIEIVDGVVWAGTNGGASYFNRSTELWFTINKETSEGIPENRINDILNTQEFLWFGTGGGVSRFNKSAETWEIYTTTDGLAHNYVNSILQDGNKMWIATNGGVSVYNLCATTQFLPVQDLESGHLPDLALSIDDIKFSNYEPVEGEKVTVTVNLRNLGAQEVSAWIGVYQEDFNLNISVGNVIEMVQGDFSNQNPETVNIEWQPTKGGQQYSLYFILDPYDEVPEQDKNNNRVIVVIHVDEPVPEESTEATNPVYIIIAALLVVASIILYDIRRRLIKKRRK
jgi:ligand-binding sensor domain-containing protein